MNKPDYVSNIEIDYQEGPNRLADMPVDGDPVEFGVHGAIAEHYGMDPEEFGERNTTIDFVVAAAAGWLTGTFAGALEARDVSPASGNLSSDVRGVIRKNENNVLIIQEIHVTYHLDADPNQKEVIERVHDMHAEHCPVSESISPCIDIQTSLDLSWIC